MPETPQRPTPPRRNRKWLRRGGYSGLVLTVIAASTYFMLPPIAGWQIETRLEKLGARSVKMDGLSINPVTGEISVERFASVGPDGGDISVGAATLRVSLSALARRQITIQKLTVADAEIDLRLDAKGRWSVGGFPMAFADDKAKPDSDEPWKLKATNIAVDNSRMTLAIGKTRQTALVQKMRLDTLSTLRPEAPTSLHLSARAAGGTLRLDGKAYPFAAEPNVAVAVALSDIDLKTFEGLVATGRIKSIAGSASIKGELTAGQTKTGGARITYAGALSVAGMKTETTLFSSRSDDLSWNGQARLAFAGPAAPAGTLPEIGLKGVAAAQAFRFENKTSRMALAAKTARFDFSKSGLEMRADKENKDATEIVGGVVARLTAAWLDDPGSDLKISQQQLDIQGDVRLNLPPKTAAFSARLSGSLGVQNLKGALKSAGIGSLAASTLRLVYDDAEVALDASGGISAKATARMDIAGLDLDAPKLGISATAERLGSDGQKLAFDGTGGGPVMLQSDGRFRADNVRAKDAGGRWETLLNKLSWQGRIALGDKNTSQELTISGDASATGMSATLLGDTPYRISLDDTRLTGIAVDDGQSRIETITLNGIGASDRAKTSSLPRVRMKSLRLSGASATDGNRLVLESVRGSGLSGTMVRTKSGTIALPSAGRKAPGAAGPARPEPAGKPGSIRIDDATLTDSSLTFTDRSTDPEFSIETSRLQATLKGLDTARRDSDARFGLLVGLGKFGRVDAKGSFKPVFDRVTADVGIGFKNVEMFKFNAYVAPAIEHTVRQGRADGSLDVKLRKSAIEATTSLVLNRLKVKPLSPAVRTVKAGGESAKSVPPMETAIGLLENDKGIIKLSIPISGSLNDPKFDLSNAIGQAVAGAMQKTLLTAFKIAFPLGTVVAIVDAVGNPKVEIKPLVFAPGTSELTPVLKNRIAEVAAYLRKKPDAAPSICGPATAADLAVLQKGNPKADKTAAIKIAADRMAKVREELVTKRAIAAKRLFLCDPEYIDGPDVRPVITFELKN